ncbi:ZCHC3 protein, partial [Atractosteus spatula]|nr:ZCHC3 protein [Atractosteus spatula]
MRKTNQRTITVHTHNPYVPTERVTAYLGRYVTVVGKPTEIRDDGVWYGKRQYRVLLKEDPEGVDGFQQPPARFNIGADRGYLFFPWMPDFCNKCRQSGHKANTCDIVRCHNCNEDGHLAKTCRAAKKCNGCGAEGHLLRQCKVSKPSFVQVVEAGQQKPVSRQRERGENKEPAPPPQRTETAEATPPAALMPQDGRQEDGQNGQLEEGPWITPSKKGKRKREKRARADPPSEGQKKRVVRENRFLVLEETELSSLEAQEQPEEAPQEMETLPPEAQRRQGTTQETEPPSPESHGQQEEAAREEVTPSPEAQEQQEEAAQEMEAPSPEAQEQLEVPETPGEREERSLPEAVVESILEEDEDYFEAALEPGLMVGLDLSSMFTFQSLQHVYISVPSETWREPSIFPPGPEREELHLG